MKLLTWAMDLIFPPKCPFCTRILENPRETLCPNCQPKLPWLTHKAALRRVEFTAGCCSPLLYKEQVRKCIHRYKFTHVRAYAKPLGTLMAQCVRDHGEITPDVVTWVPLSRKRLRERGFDQARELAQVVGRELGIPVQALLSKDRDTERQSSMESDARRKANVLGVYSLRPEADVQRKCVLVVDDVVTSGATLSACAKVLDGAGAERIWCVTLAQAGN